MLRCIHCVVVATLNGSNPLTIGPTVLAGKEFTTNGIRLMDFVYIVFQYLSSSSAYLTPL